MYHQLQKGGAGNAKTKKIANRNSFGTKIFTTFLLRKCIPILDVFVTNKKVMSICNSERNLH